MQQLFGITALMSLTDWMPTFPSQTDKKGKNLF